MISIVVVDDEVEIAELVRQSLRDADYEIHCFYNGEDALAYIREHPVDLAVLDVMLPDMDGFSLCMKIRQDYYFPIIMLTAKVEDMDKITGLTLGADDYMTKPFQPLELMARVRTQLRRYRQYNRPEAVRDEEEISIRGLFISKKLHKCILNEREIILTPLEFDILWYLCRNQGEVIPTERLFEEVWGERYLDSNNTVMAHIARIREKMGEPSRKPRYIKTVWGVGYTVE